MTKQPHHKITKQVLITNINLNQCSGEHNNKTFFLFEFYVFWREIKLENGFYTLFIEFENKYQF